MLLIAPAIAVGVIALVIAYVIVFSVKQASLICNLEIIAVENEHRLEHLAYSFN